MKYFMLSVFWVLILFEGFPEGSSQKTEWNSRPNPDSVLAASISNNNSSVCAIWGKGAVRTFDNYFYHFASTCYFTLTSVCEDPNVLNVRIRHTASGQLQHIFMEIEGAMISVKDGEIMIKGFVVTVPYDDKVISVQPYGIYVKFSNRKGTISLIWDLKSALSVTLDAQYLGGLCGLCRDINHNSNVPEELFKAERVIYSSQLSDSRELCVTTVSEQTKCALASNCSEISDVFLNCTDPTIQKNYLEMCQKDACTFIGNEVNSVCAHFEEVARQCGAAVSEEWQQWRQSKDCAQKACPGNQIYKECGPACISTCTDPNPQHHCQQCVNTCDCPQGTVLDNIRKTDSCILQMECPCTHAGTIYVNGQKRTDYCQICTCIGGEWHCTSLNCPHVCRFEEGSYITTFDSKSYQLMGDCSYIAAFTNEWLVKVEMHPCMEGHLQICLESVVYTHAETEYCIKKNGVVSVNGNLIQMPLKQSGTKIFHQSSSYIQISTDKGLNMQLYINEIAQLYISLSDNLKGTVKDRSINIKGHDQSGSQKHKKSKAREEDETRQKDSLALYFETV
ncbi:mucin-6-like [Scyliorhinus canicula]|uniref:mucin-6-like n=1 Tax=Scyliorhinus canicula TaxID=7830 RepID=UPI0018F49B19|nr:mucin-6-like [Scyliorhinus canicula]